MKFKTTRLAPFGLSLEPADSEGDIRQLDVSVLRDLFHREHLILLRGFRGFETSEEFADYCALWGEIGVWPFGRVLEVIEQRNPADHIFDHSYVPLHWDGMYRPRVPELQIFQCVRAPGSDQGGRTTFSHTAIAVTRAPAPVKDLWKRVTGVYQRKMEFYHSKTAAPVLTQHPSRGFPVIRYCEPPQEGDTEFINHPDLKFEGVMPAEVAEFHRTLRKALYAPESLYAHAWQTGDVIFADNHTLLHGREAFVSGAPRHLRRVHVLGNTPLENPHLLFHR